MLLPCQTALLSGEVFKRSLITLLGTGVLWRVPDVTLTTFPTGTFWIWFPNTQERPDCPVQAGGNPQASILRP